MGIRGGTELSERTINPENVGMVLRPTPVTEKGTRGKDFVVDSLMDWKPVKNQQKNTHTHTHTHTHREHTQHKGIQSGMQTQNSKGKH